ncbi:MAG: fluoride efflux transporter CrcB [Bryobacteraceae bacterium]|nr:fluoride efflux transporter CrcB [Bryobacteraceae bacterium]MDW8378346.1 fluoride efflux transporter CrcB [Bryobacterales bacterium]
MEKYFVVFVGAGIGGLLRFLTGVWLTAWYRGRFPLGTFAVNVTGSFLVGLLVAFLTERAPDHPYWRLFFVVGLLGGYTTFSTFELELFQAARETERALAFLYALASVTVGYLAVWLGALLGSRR